MLVAMLAVVASIACERGPATPRIVGTPTPLDPARAGVIEGRVLFEGAPPAPRTIPVTSDPACATAHPDGIVVQDVRGTDGGLADAFVYLARGLEERVFAVPAEPVVLDQRGCWYEPRVAGAMAGQPIVFRSSDDTLHNVHGEPRANTRWNFGLPRQHSERTLILEHPEVMVPVRCDVHPWMRLDLGVLPHPYFAVTGTDGWFRLANVPAGTYTLAIWHPTLGTRELPIEVTAQETVRTDVRLSP